MVNKLIWIFCIVIITISACQSVSSGNRYYKLKIVMDSTFKYIDNSLLVSKDKELDISEWTYDTVAKSLTFQCDSLSPDSYCLKIKTIFRKEQNTPFSLLSDTTIYVKNKMVFQEVEVIDKTALLKADTIDFVYIEKGCFRYYDEKNTIVKNSKDSCYLLTISSSDGKIYDKSRNVSADIIDGLYELQINKQKQNGWGNISTNSYHFLLLVKNQLFHYRNMEASEYDSLRIKYFARIDRKEDS